MRNKFLKNIINIVGVLLTFSSIGFVIFRLSNYWEHIPTGTLTWTLWLKLVALAGIYCAANLLLIYAWMQLLKGLKQKIKFRQACEIYGISQLAKYIPGNIFQIAGRQVLSMSRGFSLVPIAKSTMLELLLLILAGGICSALIIPLLVKFFVSPFNIFLFLTLCIFIYSINMIFNRKYYNYALSCYLSFLIISGVIFLFILRQISDVSNHDFSAMVCIVGSYIIAWLIGLITPGSPAGIGIREYVLIFLMTSLYPQGDIILAVVLGRVITVLGDCMMYVLAFFIRSEFDDA